MFHISYGVAKNCENFIETYGEICVHCNACGRFDMDTRVACQMVLYRRYLLNEVGNIGNEEFKTETQKKNIILNISSTIDKIARLQGVVEPEELWERNILQNRLDAVASIALDMRKNMTKAELFELIENMADASKGY